MKRARRQVLRVLTVFLVLTACSSGSPATTHESTTTAPRSGAESLETVNFDVPFRIPANAGWTLEETFDFEAFVESGDNLLVFATAGPPDGASWVDYLTSDPEVLVTEQPSIEVGGHPATVLDLALVDSATSKPECDGDQCFVLYSVAVEQQGNVTWALVADHPSRVWIVDVDGETVAIFAEAPSDDFEGWVAEAETALSELEWMGS